jgi:phosphoglucomutase
MGFREEFNKWLEDDYFDQDTKNELLSIQNDEKEVEDRLQSWSLVPADSAV